MILFPSSGRRSSEKAPRPRAQSLGAKRRNLLYTLPATNVGYALLRMAERDGILLLSAVFTVRTDLTPEDNPR